MHSTENSFVVAATFASFDALERRFLLFETEKGTWKDFASVVLSLFGT